MSEKQGGGLKRVGAFWRKTAKSGLVFYNGNVEIDGVKTKLLLFQNKDKRVENSPDLTLHTPVDDDCEQQQKDSGQPQPDDIPF